MQAEKKQKYHQANHFLQAFCSNLAQEVDKIMAMCKRFAFQGSHKPQSWVLV